MRVSVRVGVGEWVPEVYSSQPRPLNMKTLCYISVYKKQNLIEVVASHHSNALIFLQETNNEIEAAALSVPHTTHQNATYEQNSTINIEAKQLTKAKLLESEPFCTLLTWRTLLVIHPSPPTQYEISQMHSNTVTH